MRIIEQGYTQTGAASGSILRGLEGLYLAAAAAASCRCAACWAVPRCCQAAASCRHAQRCAGGVPGVLELLLPCSVQHLSPARAAALPPAAAVPRHGARYREHLPCRAAAAGQLHLPGSAVAGSRGCCTQYRGSAYRVEEQQPPIARPHAQRGGCRGGAYPHICTICTHKSTYSALPPTRSGGVQGGRILWRVLGYG